MTGTMQQLRNMGAPEIADLGPAKTGLSLREFVDNHSRPTVALSKRSKDSPKLHATALRAEKLAAESKRRASQYNV